MGKLYAEASNHREKLKFFGLAEKDSEKKLELQRIYCLGKPTSGKTTDYSKISALSGSQDGIESFVSSSRTQY